MHMAKHGATILGIDYEDHASASCEFHAEDHAGYDTDQQFKNTKVFDQYLRLVKVHFGRGKGQYIARSVAREIARIIISSISRN